MNILAGLVIIALALINLIDMKKYEDLKKKKKKADSAKGYYADRLMKLNNKIHQAEKENKNYILIEQIKEVIEDRKSNNNF